MKVIDVESEKRLATSLARQPLKFDLGFPFGLLIGIIFF